jgi:DNA-binding protein HU-beta
MTLNDLINELDIQLGADSPGKSKLKKVLNALGSVTEETLRKGEADASVPLPGIGTLKLKHVDAREGRNPRTGVPAHIPAH